MDNQNQNSGQIRIPENMRTKKKVWVIILAVVILIVLIGAYFVWMNYLSPAAQSRRQLEENYEKYTSAMKTFEETMRNDAYGGKTPEETLAMFIDALKKGDVTLASKYFMLDTNTQSPDYLTRRKWESGLLDVYKNGKIPGIISTLESLKIKEEDNFGDASFQSLNSNGLVEVSIEMILNKYSQVWKIESM